ncbi:MAG: DUF3987 domain-containing protein [Pseudomonadota bacterium]
MKNLLNQPISPQAAGILGVDEFDGDEQIWYIMQRALDVGADPNEAAIEIPAALKRRQRLLATTSTTTATASTIEPNCAPSQLEWPPGFAGEIARFIFGRAPRPVREVAIVGALGLLAGVCGREWCIPGSGLNIYVVLVARSGIGKEAMHSGISSLIDAACVKYLRAGEFVCYEDFASGPALTKYLISAPRSVNVAGELGHKFSAMASDKESAMRSLRRVLTNLYSKSGRGNVAGGIAYSSQENNVASIEGAAYSLIGETTPGTFFESITRGMMEDGFMSRFSVVEYTGDRPSKNPDPFIEPDPAVVSHLVTLMQQAHDLEARQLFQDVSFSSVAEAMFEQFGHQCDHSIREAPDDEAVRQMWNRAELKALRIAALLAVGDNYLKPVVSSEHAEWAIGLVRRDIAVFSKRVREGDVGEGSDGGRERQLVDICREYLLLQDHEVPNWARKYDDARRVGVVPHSYLSNKTQRRAAFEKHARGHSFALKSAITTAIENGRLHRLTLGDLERRGLSPRGQMYGLIDLDPQ